MKTLFNFLFNLRLTLVILGGWLKSIQPEDVSGVKMYVQEGELVVVGSNDVEIPLPKLPHFVEVEFVKDQILVPCDPHHHHHHHRDHLHWYIKHYAKLGSHHKSALKIEWIVKEVRTIKWKIYF
jgi:hypothetical protein